MFHLNFNHHSFITTVSSQPFHLNFNENIIFIDIMTIVYAFSALGGRKGIRPLKTSASEPIGMVVNVNGRGTAQSTMWVQRVWAVLWVYYDLRSLHLSMDDNGGLWYMERIKNERLVPGWLHYRLVNVWIEAVFYTKRCFLWPYCLQEEVNRMSDQLLQLKHQHRELQKEVRILEYFSFSDCFSRITICYLYAVIFTFLLTFILYIFDIIYSLCFTLSALMLLVVQHEGKPTCKNWCFKTP